MAPAVKDYRKECKDEVGEAGEAVETVEDAVDVVTLEDGVALETVEDGVAVDVVHGSVNAAITTITAAIMNLNTAAILMQMFVQAMIQHAAITMITAVTTAVSTRFANVLVPLLARIKNAGEDGVVLETVEDGVVVGAVADGVAVDHVSVDAAIAITVAAMTNLNTAAISMQVFVQAMIQHVAETMITAVTTTVSTLSANVPIALLVFTQEIRKWQTRCRNKYSFLTFQTSQ